MSNLKKLTLVILFLFCLFLVYYIGNIYRPYVYLNNINDWGIADVGYNPIAVFNMTILRLLSLYNITKNTLLDIILNTMVLILLELISYFFDVFGVFDYKDLIALIFSLFFSFLLVYLVNKNLFNNNLKKIVLKCKLIKDAI